MTLPGLENAEDAFGLSPAQAGMVFETIAAPDAGYYAGLFDAILPRDIDVELFKSVWSEVIARHQALRSLIIWRNVASPIQVVRKTASADYWREENVNVANLRQRLEAIRRERVVFEKCPALGFHLLHRNDGRIHFAWVCHHALVDDWSVANALQETEALYRARKGGTHSALPAAATYRAFAQWLSQRNDDAAVSFWRGTLGDFNEPIRLPAPHHAAAGAASSDSVIDVTLSSAASSELKDAARQLRVTLASVIATALGVVLHRTADTDDVMFGMATTQRPSEIEHIEKAVGNFVTTCPVRLTFDETKTLTALIMSANQFFIASQQHAHLPLRRITELCTAPAKEPLFDTVLSINQGGDASGDLFADGYLFEEPENYATAHYGLSVLVTPGASIRIRILYDETRCDAGLATAITNMITSALTALPKFLDEPAINLPVAMIDGEPDATSILAAAPPSGAPPDLAYKLIRERARETPEAPAIATLTGAMTYRELHEMSAQVAASLTLRGLGRGDRIGLVMDRRPEAVAAMLGALQAGCAYAPIDPDYPPQRIAEILGDLDAPLAMTLAAFTDRVTAASPSTAVLAIDALETVDPQPDGETPHADDPAYILYTSGSTGASKGVIVTHANLAFSTAARRTFYDDAPKSFLLLSPITFDSSVVGVFWTLCNGGTLILPASGVEKSVAELGRLLAVSKPTHTLALPSLLDVLFDYLPAEQLTSFTTIIAAGESLHGATTSRLKAAAPQARIYNEYGPTEATVWCAACEVTDLDHDAPAPIGVSIPGVHLSIRDKRGRPVPQGIPGELYVGGPGIAAGYLNKPTETQRSFVPDPAASRERLYRTGDRVRLGSDGQLEFLGRVDRQIKLRGRRIEPEEIETVLTRHDGVSNAAVKPFGEGPNMRLIAFVAGAEGAASSAGVLRRYLAETLPEWMSPDHFVFLRELPLTRTGKIDRAALTEPDIVAEPDDDIPESPLEESLVDIWRQALSLDRAPGVNENFFDLGGNSLTAMRVFNEVEKQLGLTLPYAIIGKISTIAEQARQIETSSGQSSEEVVASPPAEALSTDLFSRLAEEEIDILRSYMARWPGEPAADGSMLRILNGNGRKPPLIWCFNNGAEFDRLASRLGADQPVIGLRSGNIILDLTPANQRRNNRRLAMTLLPEVLKAQPAGPFQIGGNCQGSAVAMELALALQSAGHAVSILFIMEAVPDHAFPGRVALLFGNDSEFHPYKNFQYPERAWRRRYLEFSVDFVPGQHGTYFRRLNVGGLATAIKRRLKEATEDAPRQLYEEDCRVTWQTPDLPLVFAPGQRCKVTLTAHNNGRSALHPSDKSGVYLANRWLQDDGAILTMKDGFADIPSLWVPRKPLTFEIEVTAPTEPGACILEIDLVEEGVARFSERGGARLKVNVTVAEEGTPRATPASAAKTPNAKSPWEAALSLFKRITGA